MKKKHIKKRQQFLNYYKINVLMLAKIETEIINQEKEKY